MLARLQQDMMAAVEQMDHRVDAHQTPRVRARSKPLLGFICASLQLRILLV
jgi:hypothetical protein